MRPPRQLQTRVPRRLERICLKALATDPRQRYATAAGLAADLRRYLRWPLRRALTAAAPIGLLVLIGLGGWPLADRLGWLPNSPKEQATPAPDREPPAVVPPAELAEKTRDILQANRHPCHRQDGAVEGGFNYVLDHKLLLADGKKIVPRDPEASRLLRRIKKGEMPPEDEQPRPSEADVAVLEKWIAAGAPDFNAQEPHRIFLT